MGNWKVSKEVIKLYEHPNADRLEVARVDTYALVVEKGRYRDGDEIIFAPKNSLLVGDLAEPFKEYLSKGTKVKEVRLRGELSQGVTLSRELVAPYLDIDSVAIGEDISERLGIYEYVPPIPTELMGQVEPFPYIPNFTHFDVDNFRIFSDEIFEGEEVSVSEKLHGSLCYVFRSEGVWSVTSKGLAKKGLVLKEDDSNSYWKGVKNSQIREIGDTIDGELVHIVGELIPCQGGYSYGQKELNVRVFEVYVNGEPAPEFYHLFPWVPVLFEGAFSEEKATELSKGMETVSGRQLHIREGCVVKPKTPRRNSQGRWLQLKFINPKYKATGEEFN